MLICQVLVERIFDTTEMTSRRCFMKSLAVYLDTKYPSALL